MIMGIDVSDHQHDVDWPTVAQTGDVEFAIAKATEGLTFDAATFAVNWASIREAGLARGAYHMARPSNNSASDEADHFLSAIEGVGGLYTGDILALDLEDEGVADPHQSLLDWALDWLRRVQERSGVTPLFYSGTWYMNPHGLTGSDDLGQYPLWISDYSGVFGDPPAAPAGWNDVVIHQYTSDGNHDGITGRVDLDCFTGATIDELRTYGMPGPPVVDQLDPNHGTAGNLIVITGSNFMDGATDVGFGSVNVADLTFSSPNRIDVIAPDSNALGTVDVVVSTKSGSSSPVTFIYD